MTIGLNGVTAGGWPVANGVALVTEWLSNALWDVCVDDQTAVWDICALYAGVGWSDCYADPSTTWGAC